MQFSFTPIPISLLVASLIAALTARYAWSRRSGPGARPLALLMIAVSWWSFFYGLQAASTGWLSYFFSMCSYLGNIGIPMLFLAYALQFTGRGALLNARTIMLLAAEPLVMLPLIWSSHLFELFNRVEVVERSGTLHIATSHGPFFFVHVALGYSAILASVVLLINHLRRSVSLYRGQVFAILIGTFAPWVLNVVNIFALIEADPTPYGFVISGVALSFAMRRYRMFDLVPVARDLLVQHMDDVLVVVDERGRIVDANAAAQRIVGLSEREMLGRGGAEVFAPMGEVVQRFRNVQEASTELEIPGRDGAHIHDLRITPLRDSQGRPAGRLFVMRDITARVQAQRELEAATAAIERQNQRLRSELALAREIQLALLPAEPPWSPDAIDFAAQVTPASEIGGDFYTFLRCGSEVGVVIGDISGKGAGAALLMALTLSAVEDLAPTCDGPAALLTGLHDRLIERFQSSKMNAALLALLIDPARGRVRIANGGMIAPLLLRDGRATLLNVGGLPLGVSLPTRYVELEEQLRPGDTLLLVSDGIVEAHNPDGELYGFERLGTQLEDLSGIEVPLLVREIFRATERFASDAPQHDDMSAVALRLR